MSRGTGTGLVGLGIVFGIAGAIMRFAVHVHTSSFNIHTAGVILFVSGIAALIVGIAVLVGGATAIARWSRAFDRHPQAKNGQKIGSTRVTRLACSQSRVAERHI